MSETILASPPIHDIWTAPLTLKVRHLTRYEYDGPVWDSFNEARLHPWSDHCQVLKDFQLRICPKAAQRRYADFYGNCVDYFDVISPHPELEVEALSEIDTHADDRGPLPDSLTLDDLHQEGVEGDFHEFLHDSQFVSLEAEVWRSAIDALPQGVDDIWAAAVSIGDYIFESYTYTPLSTTVNTKPVEVVRNRRGVCQDFAHVMLAMCRSHGIPARYVSGYFYSPNRAPDENEASHAWVEVYLPGYGWKGYDPTHARVPDTRYIKLAVGRDYGDIVPVSGKFLGKGKRRMSVEVKITRAR